MEKIKSWWQETFGRVISTKLLMKKSLLMPLTTTKKDHWVDIKVTRLNKVLGHSYSVDTLSGHYTGKRLSDVIFRALIGECESKIKLSTGAQSIISK